MITSLSTMYQNISATLKKHALLFRIAAVIILFGLVFRTVRMEDILHSFREANAKYLAAALLLMIPNILLQILKWRFVVRDITPVPTIREIAVSLFGGFFIGAATPGRTGEFARGMFMDNRSFLKTASLTIVDKGFNQITVFIAGLVSLALFIPKQYAAIPLAVDAGIVIGLVNLHRLRPGLERIFDRILHSERAHDALAAFDALNRDTVAGMSMYSILFYAVYGCQYYIMLCAFADIPPVTALKTLPIVYLVNLSLPISFGDFGVKELTAMHLLARFGVESGAVFSATLLNNVITFLVPSMIGGFMILLMRYPSVREAQPSVPDTERTQAP